MYLRNIGSLQTTRRCNPEDHRENLESEISYILFSFLNVDCFFGKIQGGLAGHACSLTPVSRSHGHDVNKRLERCPFFRSLSQSGVAADRPIWTTQSANYHWVYI
jgi:hypothetical protein